MNYWDCMYFLVAFVNLGGGELKGIHGRAYAHLKETQLDKVGRCIRFDCIVDVFVMGWLQLSQTQGVEPNLPVQSAQKRKSPRTSSFLEKKCN